MEIVTPFFAGAFLCNCIPHLVAALQGAPFPTPFAKPRGVGDSSPPVNFFWGLFNLVAGLALLAASPISLAVNAGTLAFFSGAVVLGSYLSVHFGAVRARRNVH